MPHRIQGYDYFEDNGDRREADVFYRPLCDGLVEDERDVKFLVGCLWWLHKNGQRPIVAIFLPEEDSMDRTVDQDTGEIRDDSFVHMEPVVETALERVDPTKDAEIGHILQQVVDLERWAQNTVVDSLQAEKQVTNDLVIIGNIEKAIEQRRKELVGPCNEYVNHVNSTVRKLLSDPLAAVNTMVRNKILGYKKAERERIEAIERENMARVNQALLEARRASEPIKMPDIQSTGPMPATTVRAPMGTSTTVTKRVWRWKEGLSRQERLEKLPGAYLMADEKLISTVVARNKQLTDADFGGVIEIYEEDSLRVMGRKPR